MLILLSRFAPKVRRRSARRPTSLLPLFIYLSHSLWFKLQFISLFSTLLFFNSSLSWSLTWTWQWAVGFAKRIQWLASLLSLGGLYHVYA